MDNRIDTVSAVNAVTQCSVVQPQTGWQIDRTALAVASSIRLRHPLCHADLKHRVCESSQTEQERFVETALGLHEGLLLSILSGPHHSLLRQVYANTRNYVREFLELSQPVFPWPMGIKAQML